MQNIDIDLMNGDDAIVELIMLRIEDKTI